MVNNKCKILKIYVSEDSRYNKKSLYHSVVIKLRELGLAGVTVTRGIEGYGKSKRINNVKILDLSSSLPIIIEAIDKEEMINRAIPVIQDMVKEGIVITLDVDVISYGKPEI